MGFSLLIQNTLELWKEWEMRLLVLLSMFLQLTLATQVSRRRYKFGIWIHVMVWTAYTLVDSISNFALSIFSNRLVNIKQTKGTIDPKTQITAFWAPFLLLHLAGPDTITAFVKEDNDLWLRQFVRLCIQVVLVGFIYYMALLESPLWMLAAGMILVGLMKYAERILCLFWASKDQLRDSTLSIPNFVPIYPRIRNLRALKLEEGYRVKIEKVCEVPALEYFSDSDKQDATALLKAYELFKVFKLLFLGLIRYFGDLEASKRMFMNQNMDSAMAFRIVDIELGFMYDLLHTKAPLLYCAWGIIRWVISLSVPCAVLVFFSLQDKKDYAKVDICITFLLISVAILLEIYSILLAASSDWVNHWLLQRPARSAISSAMAFLQFCPSHRWSNSVAQISLLGLSVRKINRIFHKCPMLVKLDEKLMVFCITYAGFNCKIKKWIFGHMKGAIIDMGQNNRSKSFRDVVSRVLMRSGCEDLLWSVDRKEFDQIILIWHTATELCYYKDRDEMAGKSCEEVAKMSKLFSRYMLYLILLHPSMLPTGIGVLRYKDTSVDAQKFFKDQVTEISRNKGIVSSGVIKWVKNIFKKERYLHTGVEGCKKGHKSRESRDRCELCHLLLCKGNIGRDASRSVLYDSCLLASQLNGAFADSGEKWNLIGKVWANLLMYAAGQCKDHEHCGNLSRGELLSHIWLLMAHLGFAEAVEILKHQCAVKLIIN